MAKRPASTLARYEALLAFSKDGASMTEALFQELLKQEPDFAAWLAEREAENG